MTAILWHGWGLINKSREGVKKWEGTGLSEPSFGIPKMAFLDLMRSIPSHTRNQAGMGAGEANRCGFHLLSGYPLSHSSFPSRSGPWTLSGFWLKNEKRLEGGFINSLAYLRYEFVATH